jgi:hypothetical protein
LKANRLHTSGSAWIYGNQDAGLWSFTLLLDDNIRSQAEVNWAKTLPDENSHGWLEIDHGQQHLRLRVQLAACARRSAVGTTLSRERR